MVWTERDRVYAREWRARNADRVRAYYKTYDRKHPGRRRRTSMLSMYKLTEATFTAMVASQSGQCAICKKVKELVVDHDHQSGRVRGLLCRRCNGLLAGLDDAEFVAGAKAYLSRQ